MTREELVQPFDEKAALAELERLRESIQAARRARQRTSDEFDAFVKGFRTPLSTPSSDNPVATLRAVEVSPPGSESISRPLQSPDSWPSTIADSSNTDSVDVTVPLLAPVPQRRGLNIRLVGILAVIAVITLGLLSTRWPGHTSPPTRVNGVTDNAASTQKAATSTPAASPLAPSQPPAHSVVLELRTVRPVWMRVVVDGRKEVEGLVQ